MRKRKYSGIGQVSIVQVDIFKKYLHMSKTRLTFVEINFDEINFNVHLFRQMPNSWYFIHIYFGDILSVESLIKNSLILVRISFHGSS